MAAGGPQQAYSAISLRTGREQRGFKSQSNRRWCEVEPWEEFVTFWGVDANVLCYNCDFKAFAGLFFTGKICLHSYWMGKNVLLYLVNKGAHFLDKKKEKLIFKHI